MFPAASSLVPTINYYDYSIPETSLERQWNVVDEFCELHGIEKFERQGIPPLSLWISLNNIELCKKLISLGADLNLCDEENGTTALHWALIMGCYGAFKLLLEAGANPNIKNKLDDSPIHFAVDKALNEVIAWLIEVGADINMTDKFGDTPLIRASLKGYIEIIRLLLKHGAKTDIINKDGETALYYALQSSSALDEAAILLIHSSENINIKTVDGETPLSLATLHHKPQIIHLLLSKGADVCVLDQHGRTPVLNIYLKYPHLLQNYCEMLNKDNGFSQKILELRLLGHKFSLKNEMFTHFSAIPTYIALSQGIERFAQMYPKKGPLLQKIIPIFYNAVNQNLTSKDYVENFNKGELVALQAGCIGHACSVVLFKDEISIGNRGFTLNPNLESGIRFYKIQNLKSLEEAITFILAGSRNNYKNCSVVSGNFNEQKENQIKIQMTFFENGIHEILGLKEIENKFIRLTDQKSGNCGQRAAEMTLKSSLIFLESKSSLYKRVIHFDRNWSLSLLDFMEQDPFINGLIQDDFYQDLIFPLTKSVHEVAFKQILAKRPHLVNAYRPSKDESLLYRAIDKRRDDLACFLLGQEADPNFKTKFGYTSLNNIAYLGSTVAAQCLLQHGAEVDVQTPFLFTTPLMHACRGNNVRMTKLLLKENANVNHCDYEGKTSLHHVAEKGYLEMCKILIDNHANIDLKSINGQEAIDLARANNHQDIVDYLSGLKSKSLSKTEWREFKLQTPKYAFD